MELPNGVSSSDTIRVVAGNIDAAYFYQAVVKSLEELVNDIHTAVRDMDRKSKSFQWTRRKAGLQGIWQ